MSSDYRIHLNFLPVVGHVPPFRAFRRLRADGDCRPDLAAASYSLPTGDDVGNRAFYWVRFDPADDYQELRVRPEDNNDLTRWAMFHALRDMATKLLRPEQFDFEKRGFLNEIRFVMAEHAEGQELLVLQPYRLRETKQFGCLADFHFRMKPGVPYSRRVQPAGLGLGSVQLAVVVLVGLFELGGGRPFTKSTLHQLLTNVTYLGKVRYKDEVHDGEHQPIIDNDIWDQVQHVLRHHGRGEPHSHHQSDALLKGLLFCQTCRHAITPAHSIVRGKKYRYYICTTRQKLGAHRCPSKPLPADRMENAVLAQLRPWRVIPAHGTTVSSKPNLSSAIVWPN